MARLRRWCWTLVAWRAHVGLLYLLILGGMIFRTTEALRHSPLNELWSDPGRHWAYGKATLDASPGLVMDPPLFQMWMSLVQKWSLGQPLLIDVYTVALSNVTAWIWYRFLRVALRSRALALVGWAVFVWLPSWVAIYRYFMTETLFLPLLGASLWQTVRASRTTRTSAFVGMALLWGLTALTRGVGLPLGGMAGLWVWLNHPFKVRTAAASLLLIAAMLVPFGIRNYEAIRQWSPIGSDGPAAIYAASGARSVEMHFTRNGAGWVYGYGSPALYSKPLEPFSDWDTSRVGEFIFTANLDKGSEDWVASYERAVHRWPDPWTLRWENLVLIMVSGSWPDQNPDSTVGVVAGNMRWVWAPLFVVVMVFAAIQFRATLRRPLLPLLIVTWFAVQTLTLVAVNEGRYRKPLEGLLIAQVLVLLDRRRPRFA